MKLQTVTIEGKTYAEVQDGKPVFITDDGATIAFDAPGTRDTITKLNAEAKGHREAKETAEKALKAFEGVDPGKAREAVEKLSLIDAKKLVEAGDMDAAIQAAIKPYAEKLTAAEQTNQTLQSNLTRSTVGNRFSQSKFASEKLTPAGVDLIRNLYGDRIKVEGDDVYGVDMNGAKMLSIARPGQPADFDEIVEALTNAYPHKDHILRGQIGDGGGANNNGGGGGAKVIKPSEFESMSPKERAAKMADGYTIAA